MKHPGQSLPLMDYMFLIIQFSLVL